jgi:hypothetical protein
MLRHVRHVPATVPELVSCPSSLSYSGEGQQLGFFLVALKEYDCLVVKG